MFNSISWGQYFTTILLILVCYYIVIFLRFYRWEILSVIGIKKVSNHDIAIPTVVDFKNSIESESQEGHLDTETSPAIQSFTDEIKAYLQQSTLNTSKDKLLGVIQGIAIKYTILKNTAYKPELEQFIFYEINAKYPNLIQLNDVKKLFN